MHDDVASLLCLRAYSYCGRRHIGTTLYRFYLRRCKFSRIFLTGVSAKACHYYGKKTLENLTSDLCGF